MSNEWDGVPLIKRWDTPAKDASDTVNHPKHYTAHPSGVECIQITEHMSFNLGNAVKYIWRFEGKNGVEDLRKARWYIDREIQRLGELAERGKKSLYTDKGNNGNDDK